MNRAQPASGVRILMQEGEVQGPYLEADTVFIRTRAGPGTAYARCTGARAGEPLARLVER